MFRPVSVIIRFLTSLLKSVTYFLNLVVMLRSQHLSVVLYTIYVNGTGMVCAWV